MVVRAMVGDPMFEGAPVVTPVALSSRLGMDRFPDVGMLSCAKTNRPARTSHNVEGETVCVNSPKVIAGTEVVRRRTAANGVAAVGGSEPIQCS